MLACMPLTLGSLLFYWLECTKGFTLHGPLAGRALKYTTGIDKHVISSRKNPLCHACAQVVYKHGVTFVSSAGNAGPALSTVGAPGGTSSAIISIGAYVSPALAAAGHSVREALDKVPLVSFLLASHKSTWLT